MISEIYSNSIYMLLTTLLFAIAIDLLIAEFPVEIHPVVWIGNLINFFKKYFININNKLSGLLISISIILTSSLIVLVPLLLIKHLLYLNDGMIYLFKIIAVLLLSSTFSVKLLLDSASNLRKDLKNNNLNKARKSLSYLVSRKTNELSKEHIISAVIETLTENIPDSYVSTIFYYSIVGIIASLLGLNDFNVIILAILAALIHRAVDTMDSMLGYKSDELYNIGYIPAILDDALNYIPARISGILIVISSGILGLNWRGANFIMRRDARNCDSPNSGYTMATVAGALNIQLEKEGVYTLGDNIHPLKVECIDKAVDITRFTIFLTTIFFFFVFMDLILLKI
ncbi:cobalamin biosynthesis protein [Methanobrevibacter olleyae]|uniref:Probable cobalamin biosynthesis protein CobD n=1 Tax=Methanobrevibacter olleyae TaxID=294671 RepID=A0A126R246_METOL|nr:cobalamin biosynthesis protein [Methanobrevibacter olleyae]AMK16167.1 cobalamin biosynthesis protein CbiB [Methanobrevibacter olleyae]SFL31625.1 adenosylcobinamide-phosphate synthase [Methanobrevibacter olleyae]